MEKLNKSIMVYDNGGFTFIASCLAKYFDKVYLYTRWENGYPFYGAKNIGRGVEGTECVEEPDSMEDDIDIFLFTDIYFKGTANRLIKEGRKVWGSGDMEMIERSRHIFYDMLIENKMPVPNTIFINGFEELMKYLKDKKNLWVKLSEYRGNGETFKWIDKNFDEFFMSSWKEQLGIGIYDKELEFIIQEEVDTELEWGVDTYMVNSKFPGNMFVGFEQKGESMFTKIEDVKNLPSAWRDILKKFEDAVAKYNYTGPISLEVRSGKDGKEYVIDPTVRYPYPGTAAQLHICKNYGDIITKGLYEGKTTTVETTDKYAAEIVLGTEIKDMWIPAYTDKKENTYLVSNAMLDDVSWRVPPEQLYSDGMILGSVVGSSNDLKKAIEEADETEEGIKSIDIESNNEMCEKSEIITEQLKKIYNYKY